MYKFPKSTKTIHSDDDSAILPHVSDSWEAAVRIHRPTTGQPGVFHSLKTGRDAIEQIMNDAAGGRRSTGRGE